MSDPNLPEQIAAAVVHRLTPTIIELLSRHQERMTRLWLTPPQAARLIGCRDQVVYAALHDGSLPGTFNPHSNGGRGAWHIRRSDFERWANSNIHPGPKKGTAVMPAENPTPEVITSPPTSNTGTPAQPSMAQIFAMAHRCALARDKEKEAQAPVGDTSTPVPLP